MKDRKITRRELAIAYLKKPENWINLVNLVVAVILGYRSLTTGEAANYFQAILLVLGLLALSQLVVGYSSIIRDHQIEELTSEVTQLRHAKPSADTLFITRQTIPQWEERLKRAKFVDGLGMSLTTLVVTNQALLRDLLHSGAKIRLVVSNPDNEALQAILAKRTFELDVGEQHGGLVRAALKYVEKLVGIGASGGQLQVRITDHVTAFSYIGIDTPTAKGNVSVEFYLNKVPLAHNPILMLDANKDPHWYDEFKKQFDYFWDSAEDIAIVKKP